MAFRYCIICNSTKYRVICKTKDYRYGLSNKVFPLVKCVECGLIYLNPRPSEKNLRKFYPEEYYRISFGSIEEKLGKYLSDRKIFSLAKIKKTGKLLDVGCGTGDFLLQMKNRGYEVCGIDASLQACKIARKKKLKIYSGNLKKQRFPNKFFDIVTLWHVFEHLRNPSETLKEIRRILKNDGLLIMETPNIDCFSFKVFGGYHFHLDSPRHFYHWTKNSIERILNKNGFWMYKTDYPILNYPLSSFHSFKNFSRSRFAMIIAFPLLALITLLSQIIPSKRETIRIYAGNRRFLSCTIPVMLL